MEITDIKARLTMATVLNHYNLKPDRSQRLNCPFHDDRTPSLQVYPKTNTCYCFSSNCHTHGKSVDVIDFIMYRENCSKSEAIKKAIEIMGEPNPSNTQPPKPKPVQRTKEYQELPMQRLDEVFGRMKSNLRQSQQAREYCQGRGLIYDKLEIGYNGRTYKGIMWSIVFPLRDPNDKIVSFYGRSTLNNSESRHFYLKDSTGLYPKYPSPETERLIITESIIDCATLLQIEPIAKNYSLLASYGTNRLNEEMKTALQDLPNLKEIILALDNDSAGRTATAKYAQELITYNPQLIISTLELPNKDVNETLLAHSEAIFAHLLQNRKPVETTMSPQIPDAPGQAIADAQLKTKIIEFINEIPKPVDPPLNPGLETLNSTNPNKLTYSTESATYSILGGMEKPLSSMKVMLQVEDKKGSKSRNRIDLYEERNVEKLAGELAEKLELKAQDILKDLMQLTDLLDGYRDTAAREASETETDRSVPETYLTAEERTEATEFLRQPRAIKRLNELLGKTGIVGEERNRIFLLLIALSYKTKDPLHSLVQGSSGSGKTKIVRQISDCIPQESVTRFTRISDKALYNYTEHYFKNRLLIIEDVDGLSEEAELAFRELQSSGELRSSVSIKLESGKISSGEKVVRGPIASMSCTTKGEIYEDNMSRAFLIAVDESLEQTKRIVNYQNELAAGLIDRKSQLAASAFVRNLVRIIEVKDIINPYAQQIQLPEEAHKIRRLNDLFHNFIKMATLINQYQRKTKNGKLITEIEDIETAIEIMFESIVLKVDELDGSLRQFYERLKNFVSKKGKNYEFDRFEVREATGVGKTQQHFYINKLVELEYVQQNGFANRGFKYKITQWDNYTALRDRIKGKLKEQIEAIKSIKQTTPEHLSNANRTPKTQTNY